MILSIPNFTFSLAAAPRPVRIAYCVAGPEGAPIVAVLGGISANRFVAGDGAAARAELGASGDCADAGPSNGWWSDVCGPGRAVDTDRVRVLSFDYLGGGGESSGPDEDDFPQPTTHDQARALAHLLDALGVERAHSLIGASYGGMVALAFAESFPERLDGAVVISAAHKCPPMATASRAIQRRIVDALSRAGAPEEGLAIARALAMTTYRTAEEFDARFAGERLDADDLDSFPVWSYLKAQGERFARRGNPRSYALLSRSIDLHRVRPEAIRAPLAAVSIKQDILAPPWLCEELARGAGGPAESIVLDSIYGHDAFLKEHGAISRIIERRLRRA